MQTKRLTLTVVMLSVLSNCSSPPPIDYAAEVAALAEEAWQRQVEESAYFDRRSEQAAAAVKG